MANVEELIKKAEEGNVEPLEDFVRELIEDKEEAVKALRFMREKLDELESLARDIADMLEG